MWHDLQAEKSQVTQVSKVSQKYYKKLHIQMQCDLQAEELWVTQFSNKWYYRRKE